MGKIDNLKSKIKRYGYIGIIERFIYCLFELFCIKIARKRFMSHDLINYLENHSSNNWYGHVKKLTVEDCKHMSNGTCFPECNFDFLSNRLSDPDFEAYGIVQNHKVIGVGLIAFKTTGWKDFDNVVPLKTGDGFLFMDWTHPDFRGLRIHRAILDYRLNKLKMAGYKRAIIEVDTFNRASYKGIQRSGFKRLYSYFLVNVFGKVFNGLPYGK